MTPPRLAAYHLREYCAAAASHLLRVREARYPALIEAGKLKASDAAASLELARVIVAQWTWAMDPAGSIDPPWTDALGYSFGAFNYLLIDELKGAAHRARAIADRTGAEPAVDFADLCEALLWWQDQEPGTYEARIVRRTGCDRRWAVRMAREAAERAKAAT